MESQTAYTWSWLNILTRKRYNALMEVYADLDEALGDISQNMLKNLGCREETVMIALNRLDEFDPEQYQKELEKRSLQIVTIEEDLYPVQLKEVPDAPVFLYYRGDLSVLDQPCIGLVGTRKMSAYGKRIAESFVPEFVRAGMVTVSGLAQGIDSEVARCSIAESGKTVAVLGHGLSQVYPRSNANLAEEIIGNGGLIMSEFPLDIAPDKYTFPARNRIIAGLSLGTVVLEAGEGSGALITADLSLEYNRDVFAVPGQIFDPNFMGCHQLIAKGQARLVISAEEVLSEIGVVASVSDSAITYTPQNEIEEAIYNVLTTMPQSVTDLVERSTFTTGPVNASLTVMELGGAVKNVGNGMWVKV